MPPSTDRRRDDRDEVEHEQCAWCHLIQAQHETLAKAGVTSTDLMLAFLFATKKDAAEEGQEDANREASVENPPSDNRRILST